MLFSVVVVVKNEISVAVEAVCCDLTFCFIAKRERESIPILYTNDCYFAQEFLRLDGIRQAAQHPWIIEVIKSTMHCNQKMKFTLLSDLAGINYQNTHVAKIQC